MLPLVFYVFIDVIAFSSVIIAVLPFHVMFLGAGPLVVTLYMSTFSFVQFFASPYIGRLSDKFGRKPMLITSCIADLFSHSIMAIASSLNLVLLSRVIAGLFSCNISVGTAYISDITSSKDRTKYIGYYNAAFSLGFVIGPIVGGLLAGSDPSNPNIFIAKAILANTLKEMATKKYNDAENNRQENRALLIYNLLNEMLKYNSKFDYTIGGKDIINPFITALPLLSHSNYEIIIRVDNSQYPKILVLDNSIEDVQYLYSWTLRAKYWTLQRTPYDLEESGSEVLGTHKLDVDDEEVGFHWVEMSTLDQEYPYLFARIWKRPIGYMINWMETNPFEEQVVFEDYEIEHPDGFGPKKKERHGYDTRNWGSYKAEYV